MSAYHSLRCIQRKHTGPSPDEEASAGFIVGGFLDSLDEDPWSMQHWETPGYDRPSRLGRSYGGSRDGNPLMVGAAGSGAEVAAEALAEWAGENGVDVGKAFKGSGGGATAAGWTLYLPKGADRGQAIRFAKQAAQTHNAYFDVRASDAQSGWVLIYFTDDPTVDLAIAPDSRPDESTAGMDDGLSALGALKLNLFKPSAKRLQKRIERLEKKLAKLREKLEEVGDGGDDDGAEGLIEVGRGFRGGRGRMGGGRMGGGRGRGQFGMGMPGMTDEQRAQLRQRWVQNHPEFAAKIQQNPQLAQAFYSGQQIPDLRQQVQALPAPSTSSYSTVPNFGAQPQLQRVNVLSQPGTAPMYGGPNVVTITPGAAYQTASPQQQAAFGTAVQQSLYGTGFRLAGTAGADPVTLTQGLRRPFA